MLNNKVQQARRAILNEIAATLEHIAYLKSQASDSRMVKREELRQRLLVFKLSLLEA